MSKSKQETLHVVTTMMISHHTLASLQKFQYFQRPTFRIYLNIYEQLFCEIS